MDASAELEWYREVGVFVVVVIAVVVGVVVVVVVVVKEIITVRGHRHMYASSITCQQ